MIARANIEERASNDDSTAVNEHWVNQASALQVHYLRERDETSASLYTDIKLFDSADASSINATVVAIMIASTSFDHPTSVCHLTTVLALLRCVGSTTSLS